MYLQAPGAETAELKTGLLALLWSLFWILVLSLVPKATSVLCLPKSQDVARVPVDWNPSDLSPL